MNKHTPGPWEVSERMGTVYGGGVATDAGFKFKTPEEAWENASLFVEQCAEIVSERLNKKGEK